MTISCALEFRHEIAGNKLLVDGQTERRILFGSKWVKIFKWFYPINNFGT